MTSQIPHCEFNNGGVAVVYPQPLAILKDSPNTELSTGVTVSTTH